MKKDGFTVVELLIVIVVVAVLTTIAVVSYNGLVGQARDAAIMSDISLFRKKMEVSLARAGGGLYPIAPDPTLGAKFTEKLYVTGRNNVYYCASVDGTQYALGLMPNSGPGYLFMSRTGETARSNTVWGTQTCDLVSQVAEAARAGYSWDTATNTGSWSAWAK